MPNHTPKLEIKRGPWQDILVKIDCPLCRDLYKSKQDPLTTFCPTCGHNYGPPLEDIPFDSIQTVEQAWL